MNVHLVFKPLSDLERAAQRLYEQWAEAYEGDPEAALVFRRMAAEERTHVNLVEYQRKIVRGDPHVAQDVDVDLTVLEGEIARIGELAAAPPASADEAILKALALESSAAETHYRNSLKAANPHLGRLLDSLINGDEQHVERLRKLAERRGLLPPAG